MHNRGWTPLIPVFALMLTLLVGLYVGAYYTLVTPVRVYLADKRERRVVGGGYFMNASPQLSPRYQPVLGIQPARFFGRFTGSTGVCVRKPGSRNRLSPPALDRRKLLPCPDAAYPYGHKTNVSAFVAAQVPFNEPSVLCVESHLIVGEPAMADQSLPPQKNTRR